MKVHVMGIIFMAVAIGLGSLIGSGLASWIGLSGGLIGTVIVGLVIYAVYSLISGKSLRLWSGIIFAILVWIANMISGTLFKGVTGLLGLLFTAVILSFLWGWIGAGTGAGTGKSKKCRKRRRR